MENMHLSLLRLMQLADSALPIGATAHSYGLEMLTAEGTLTVERLAAFLLDYMQETGRTECICCYAGYQLAAGGPSFDADWLALNRLLSALKTARESRTASATLGRRLLQLVQGLHADPLLLRAFQTAKQDGTEMHYSAAFGLVGGILEGIDATTVALAYLQQALTGLVSACQRLLPLGQSQASYLIWQLKPDLLAIATDCATHGLDTISTFAPLVELGSMRHPTLTTRLFIS